MVLFWLDVAAHGISTIVSFSMCAILLAAGIRTRLNQYLGAYGVFQAITSLGAIINNLQLFHGAPPVRIIFFITACTYLVRTPLLLAVAAEFFRRYEKPKAYRRQNIAAIAGAVAVTAMSVPIAFGLLVYAPELSPAGVLRYQLSTTGYVSGAILTGYIVWTLYLFWKLRSAVREVLLALSVLIILAGFVADALLSVDFPLISVTSAISMLVVGLAVVSRQVFHPLKQQYSRLATLNALSGLISNSFNSQAIIESTASLLARELTHDQLYVFRCSENGLIDCTTGDPDENDALARWSAETGKSALVSDITKDRRIPKRAGAAGSQIVVPISSRDAVRGVISAIHRKPYHMTRDDLNLVETIARQVATALENAGLYEDKVHHLEWLDLVHRISNVATRSFGLDELLITVHNEIASVFDSDASFIALYHEADETLEFRIQIDRGVAAEPKTYPLGSGFSSLVVERKEPILVPDGDLTFESLPRPTTFGSHEHPTTWMGAPMLIGDRVVGIINVQGYGAKRYSPEDLQLLATIAGEIAVAVENARLIYDLQNRLQEQIRIEAVLRESEEKFRSLAEYSPNMIFINQEGRVVYANPISRELLGYELEEYYDDNFDFLALIAPEDRPRIREYYATHRSGQNLGPYEYTLLAKNGKRVDAINSSRIIMYQGKRAILGVVTDISPMKRYRRFLGAINALALDLELAKHTNELFPHIGRRFSELGIGCALHISYTEGTDENVSHRFALIYAAPYFDRNSVLSKLSAQSDSLPENFEIELEPRFYSAGSRPFDPAVPEELKYPIIVAPILDENRIIGVFTVEASDFMETDVAIIRAFATQIAAAWKKTRLVEDLDRNVRELRLTQQRLIHSQKLEAIGKLAGGVAHDFNNMLAAISGYADVLLVDQSLEETTRRYLEEIKGVVWRANNMVGQLLAFGKRQVSNFKRLDLNALLEDMQQIMISLLGDKVRVVYHLAESLPDLEADATQLEQMVLNIVVNARDAMPAGGAFTISTASVHRNALPASLLPEAVSHRYVRLSFHDTGEGIKPEIIDEIFDPFFSTKPDGKGSGLGLSTVHGIVAQHSGFILVESTPDKGTSFLLYLPAYSPEHAAGN